MPAPSPLPSGTPLAAPESRLRAWRRGRRADWMAAWGLRLRGYRVLAHGFRCAAGEIDLIARRGDVVVFVEVKARADLGLAADSISQHQRARISRAAALFMAGRADLSGLDCRFDAVLVMPWRWPLHLRDAWRPADETPNSWRSL